MSAREDFLHVVQWLRDNGVTLKRDWSLVEAWGPAERALADAYERDHRAKDDAAPRAAA